MEALQADLATTEGVDKLYAAAKGRTVDALLANAGRGLGHAFLDQEFDKTRHVIDTATVQQVGLLARLVCDLNSRPFSTTNTTAKDASVQRKNPVANGKSVPS